MAEIRQYQSAGVGAPTMVNSNSHMVVVSFMRYSQILDQMIMCISCCCNLALIPQFLLWMGSQRFISPPKLGTTIV